MTGPGDSDRLRELDKRINALKSAASPEKRHQEEHYSQMQHAWRMVIDLVAGLAVGFVIGYGLDVVFGTLPFLLVTFTLLGFAAGVRGMLATARELQERPTGDDPEEKG